MKALAVRLLLVVAGLFVALGIAEGLAPLVLPRRACSGRLPFWQPDRVAGWTLVPGMHGEAVVCAGDRVLARHRIEINALGQRDRPRNLARAASMPRVLVLGDSFVESLQVDLAETFAARLEHDLGVEMLNAGVSGYSTDNELRAFLARGRRYRPDAVLVLFHVGNDVFENGARLYAESPRGLPPKSWLRSRGRSPGLAACLAAHRAAARMVAGTPFWLWSHSRVVRFGFTDGLVETLGAACTRWLGSARPRLEDVYGEPRTAAWREAWTTTEALIGHLRARVERSGARFAVALGPAGLEYDPTMRLDWLRPGPQPPRDFEYPYRRLAAFLDREGIRWVSLLPALRAHYQATGRAGCYPWDGHWDPEGHAVVAGALRGFVGELAADGG